jgi:dienelactone hydrolase
MGQWERIDVDGSPMRLYVGTPSLGRACPAVIVIQHGPGVDKFIEDRVDTLAQQVTWRSPRISTTARPKTAT